MTTVSTWRWPTPSGWLPLPLVGGVLVLICALWLTAPMVEVDFVRLIGSLGKMTAFAGQMFVAPDWNYVPQLLAKMLETIEMTILGTAIAIVLSLPMGILAARNATPHIVVYRVTRDALSLMRALPELVWALVFVSAVGLGPLPGVMALAFVTVGFMGKFFAESIEVVDQKAVEGVRAHGAGWLQVRLFAMLPQALPDFVGTVMYILDHNLRAAAILGLVGAGGIGQELKVAFDLFQYRNASTIILVIFVIVLVMELVTDRLRQKAQ